MTKLFRAATGSSTDDWQDREFPVHLREFIELERKLDQEVLRAKREKQTTIEEDEGVQRANDALDRYFFNLVEKQKGDIRIYLYQQGVRLRLEHEREATQGRLAQIARLPARAMRISVEPTAQFCEETLRLVARTFWGSMRGIVGGTIDAFKKAA